MFLVDDKLHREFASSAKVSTAIPMFQFANAKGLNLMDTGAKMLFSKMSRDEFETRKHHDDVTGNRNYAALCPGWSG